VSLGADERDGSTTNHSKAPGGNNENARRSDPGGVGNQLCFADLCPTNRHTDPQLRQRLVEIIQKHNDAIMNNDAAALAADFAEDAVLVEQEGPTFGREAIEKHWADRLQKVHFSNLVSTVDPDSPHLIGADGKEVWATGGWSTTIKGKDFGPTQLKGYFSVLREGDDWKIRMLTTNVTPAPAAPAETK
jgi:ketosteroid isomerase-like protein